MIYVTRLDGSQLVVNADLIETVEHTADTVITLLDGKKLVLATPVGEVVDRVVAYRQLIARGPLHLAEAVGDGQPQFDPALFDQPASSSPSPTPTPFRPRGEHHG